MMVMRIRIRIWKVKEMVRWMRMMRIIRMRWERG